MDEDDLFAELCGVSVTTMEDVKEDDSVLLKDVCLDVERAVIETCGEKIDTAISVYSTTSTQPCCRLINALLLGKSICDGHYAQVIRSSIGQAVMTALQARDGTTTDHLANVIALKLETYVQTQPSNERLATVYEIFYVGIAFFNLFVQANYTGPALDETQLSDVIAQVATVFGLNNHAKQLHQDALLTLQVDGQTPYSTCDVPYFLTCGRALLSWIGNYNHSNWSVPVTQGPDEHDDCEDDAIVKDASLRSILDQLHTSAWWNARAAVVHERLLMEREASNTLWYEVRRGFAQTMRYSPLFPSVYVKARIHIEWGLAQNYFDKNKQGKRSFQEALEISQLRVSLSGSMGKRTIYQQKSTAQMVLLAASKYPPTSTTNEESIYAQAMAASTHVDFGGQKQVDQPEPEMKLTKEEEAIQRMVIDGEASYRNIHLDQVDPDNILLENIAFEDTTLTEQGNLQVMDQVVLLALCLDVKNSNANDGLTREEMMPYITRVLENPNNWMVYSTGLLERAWLECEASKRRERAVLQMQALVDQHTTRLTVLQNSLQAIEEAAPAYERMMYIHTLAFPPRYVLKRDLAERYFALGVVRSALEICLELEMWDDVVKCYQVIDQPTKAELIVRERLAIAPTPYMWTALGDITNDIQYYETAWTLSNHRFARAKRSLGRYFFEKGEYEIALEHYTDSVRVNPMNSSAWFIMGTMSMRLQKWTIGLRALTRVVQLEPDNGEAWGNLGSIHLTNGRFAEAFSVLQEALKQKREMWQMWENYAFCAIQIERYGEAIYALHQWLDRRHKHKRAVDPELLAWLVEGIVYPSTKKDGDDEQEQEDLVLNGLLIEEEDLMELDEAKLAVDKAPPVSNDNYKKQLALLFGRITSIVTNDAKIWQVYAHFNDGVGRSAKALDCRLKQCRALQRAGWETEQQSVEHLCKAAVRLSQDYILDGTKKSLYACRLYIRGILKKAQVDFADLDATKALAETLDQVEQLEKTVL